MLDHAELWGRAIRLAQRLSGGTASLLKRTALESDGERLLLRLRKSDAGLYSDAVRKRHRQLAGALGLRAELVVG